MSPDMVFYSRNSCLIGVLIHLGGCGVWFVKVLSSTAEQVHDFLSSMTLGTDINTASGKLDMYALCTYFVTTVFSTVCFGDVHVLNMAERLVYIVLMLYGVLVFGDLFPSSQSSTTMPGNR